MTCITISLRTDLLSHPKYYHGIYTQLEVTGAPVHDRKNQYTITVQLLPPHIVIAIYQKFVSQKMDIGHCHCTDIPKHALFFCQNETHPSHF